MVEPKEPLSERELDILRLVATGAPNKEIARQLVISPNTVKVHMRNIFTKIGVTTRTEATLYAVQIGLVRPGAASSVETAQVDGPEVSSEGEVLPETTFKNSASVESFTSGLPGITIEENGPGGAPSTEIGSPNRARGLRPWQIVLVLLAAILLVSGGIIGSRLFPATTPIPTVLSQATQLPSQTTQRWAQKAVLPLARKGMGTAEYENNFYLIAGKTPQGIDGSLLRYDPAENAWMALAKKPTPVTDIQAVLIGEKIYVPGGLMADGHETDKLEVYNPRQNTWENKAPLPTPISGYALVAFEGNLYLFGGKNGSQFFSAVYQYDPKSDHWDKRSEMSSPRAYAAAVTDGEKVRVVGGFDGKQALTANDIYFPTRDPGDEKAWESQPPLPKGRYAMGIAHLANLIYLIGGLEAPSVFATPTGLQYSLQIKQWDKFEDPAIQIGALPALFTSGNFLYVFGGETSQGLSATGMSYQAIYTILVPIQRNEKTP